MQLQAWNVAASNPEFMSKTTPSPQSLRYLIDCGAEFHVQCEWVSIFPIQDILLLPYPYQQS